MDEIKELQKLAKNSVKRIVAVCEKNGWEYEVTPLKFGLVGVRLDEVEFAEIRKVFRAKTYGLETHIPTRSALVMAKSASEYIATLNSEVMQLVEVFWQAKHGGKNSDEAVQEQRKYAAAHSLKRALNVIYGDIEERVINGKDMR